MSAPATTAGHAPRFRSALPSSAALDEPHSNKWLVSLAVLFGVLMSAIDTSVVNVALPNMQGTVGATQQEITWVSTGYLISVVILMPLTNWLSVRFGRKRVYLTSLIVFTAASMMCGFCRTLPELIFWRVVQGLGAGTLQPLAQAIFREAFPPTEQGIAMAIFGFVVMFGPAIGPTLGGWITDNYDWPWIFFINVPIGIIGFFVAEALLHDPPYMRGGVKRKVDGTGILLLGVGLATLQTVLEQGETEDWFQSSFIVIFTVISVLSLVTFVVWELRVKNPAVELHILKDRTFAVGTFISTILGVGLFAGLFLLPQYMQILLGFSATQSGLTLMPRSLTMMAMMPISGVLYNRIGARPMIATGLLLTAYSQWQMGHLTLLSGTDDILVAQIVQGAGFGLIFVALSTACLSHIPRERMTSATGLYNLIRQLGGSFGITITVTVLTRHLQQARADLIGNATSTNPEFVNRMAGATAIFLQHGCDRVSAREGALAMMERLIDRQAAMIAYEYVFLGIGLLFILCLPLLLVLRVPKHHGAGPKAAEAE